MVRVIFCILSFVLISQSFASERLYSFVTHFEQSIDSDSWLDDYYSSIDNLESGEVLAQKSPQYDQTDYVKNSASSTTSLVEDSALKDLLNIVQKEKGNEHLVLSPSEIELTIKPVKINKSFSKDLGRNFQVLNIANGEITYSENAVAKIDFNIDREGSIARFVVDDARFIPTAFELSPILGVLEVEIPVFEREEFFDFYDEYAPDAFGGNLLIDFHDQIEEVQVHSDHTAKFYFDLNMKLTTEDGDFRYLLVTGIEQGNTLVEYTTIDGLSGDKIINLQEREVFFDYPIIEEGQKKSINLYEEDILTNKLRELNLGLSSMKEADSNNVAKEIGINVYSYRTFSTVEGVRSRVEFDGAKEGIVVGYQDTQSFVLPSSEYKDYVQELFELRDLSDSCLIELNPPRERSVQGKALSLKKKIAKVNFEAYDHNGRMPLDLYYYDSDGIFDVEAGNFTERAYFIGKDKGTIFAEVQYTDGTADYLKTYCTIGDYLIEHL